MYSPNQDVEYFVDKSGGFKRFADNESIYYSSKWRISII